MYYRSHIAHFKMVKVKVILLFPLGNLFYRQQNTKCKCAHALTSTRKYTKPQTELFKIEAKHGTNENFFIWFVLH